MNDLLLLSILLAGPQHGYALKKRAGLITGQAAMHNNVVYPLLRRFVAEKWVRQRKAAGQRGQTRQMYSLTPRGRRVLVERLGTFGDAEARSAEAFHLRVGLFELLPQAVRADILERRKTYLEEGGAKFARLEAAMDLGRFGKEVVGFLRERTRAELAWIDRLRRISGSAQRKAGIEQGGRPR
ncbi:MAG: helix-turn-helix transcriptional regulator [Candidatus Acidiferrales bacterium]